MPKVSVIIPCYNQGQYLNEAVDSILNQSYQDFEIIIINDGSNDKFTNDLLLGYNRPKTRVLHTINQGLSSARNNGIRESKGEYILPLDADDKIALTYLEKAVAILESDNDIGIVYCQAEYFGKKKGRWDLPSYHFPEILLANLIFCTALFRKCDWERVGGYKPIMKYGWEDHEFWLSIIELGRNVFQIPEVGFFYRQKDDSMIKSMGRDEMIYSYEQLYANHIDLYSKNIRVLFERHVDIVLMGQSKFLKATKTLIIKLFPLRISRWLVSRARVVVTYVRNKYSKLV